MTWQRAKLKFVARFGYGDTLPTDEEQDGPFRVFGSNGPYASFSRPNTGEPAIIVGRKGSYGKVNWSSQACFASDTTFFIDSTTTCHDLRWVYWLLQTLRLDEGTDEAAVPGLSRESAYEKEVSCPSRQIQRAIADYLDRETAWLDRLVAAKERMLGLVEEKRRALITRAVTRGLNPSAPLRDSGILWLGKIPSHWKLVQFRLVTTRVDVGIAEAATHAYALTGVPLIRSTNVRAGVIDTGDLLFIEEGFAEKNKTKYLYAGDIVTVRTGNTGISAVVSENLDRCHCFTMLMSTLKCGNVAQFFCYFLNSDAGQTFFRLEAVGTAQDNISVPILKEIPVVVPPTVEQHAIVAHLVAKTATLEALRAATERTITLLKERRTALIDAAVTGKIPLHGEIACCPSRSSRLL